MSKVTQHLYIKQMPENMVANCIMLLLSYVKLSKVTLINSTCIFEHYIMAQISYIAGSKQLVNLVNLHRGKNLLFLHLVS